MTYMVDFGPNTNVEYFETMEEVEAMLNDYLPMHLNADEDFETEKQKFIANQVTEVEED